MNDSCIKVESEQDEALANLVKEVNDAHSAFRAAARTALEQSVECGLKLIEIKKNLQHGEFGPFVDTNFEFGIRTAQNYMAIAESFSLECKSEFRALLTEAGIRTAFADGPGDQVVSNLATLSNIAGPDVLEDLVGSAAIASKSALKQLVAMSSTTVKRVFEHRPVRKERKQRLEASVRRSRDAAKQKTTLASRRMSGQDSTRPSTDEPEVMNSRSMEQNAQIGHSEESQAIHCGPNPREKSCARHPTLEMFDEVRTFIAGVVVRYGGASIPMLRVELRRLADNLDEGDFAKPS